MSINSIIKRGVKSAESHGAFSYFPFQSFVYSRKDWIEKMNHLRLESDRMFDEFYPDAYDGGNVGPCGEIQIVKKDGFVYVYLIDSRGNWDSRFFTHDVIAGEFARIPPYGGFQI